MLLPLQITVLYQSSCSLVMLDPCSLKIPFICLSPLAFQFHVEWHTPQSSCEGYVLPKGKLKYTLLDNLIIKPALHWNHNCTLYVSKMVLNSIKHYNNNYKHLSSTSYIIYLTCTYLYYLLTL